MIERSVLVPTELLADAIDEIEALRTLTRDFMVFLEPMSFARPSNDQKAAELDKAAKILYAAKVLVAKQALDDGLWFAARYVTEAYLQQELRKLVAIIKGE